MLKQIVHAAILPWLDLVLLSTSVSWAVIFAMLVGVYGGKEKFHWQYDVTSTVLICSGSFTTMLLSNKDRKEMDFEQLYELLTSRLAYAYYLFWAVNLCIAGFSYLTKFRDNTEPKPKLMMV